MRTDQRPSVATLPGPCRSTAPRRPAFTLVELLAVVAIIGVLVALLLPAVQVARESARRSACSNNIKQVVLAAHNFESAKGYFPPAGRGYGFCSSGTTPSDPATTIYNASGMIHLLPYMEQGAVFDQFKLDETIAKTGTSTQIAKNLVGSEIGDPSTNGNAVACGTILPSLLCPSDFIADARGRLPGGTADQLSSSASAGKGSGPDATRSGAATNYDFVVHGNETGAYGCRYWKGLAKDKRYMSGEDTMTRTKDVTDGLSRTFFFGETTRSAAATRTGVQAWAYRWPYGFGVTTPGNGINVWLGGTMTSGVFGRYYNWANNASSMHPGGVHFAMGDAAVRFIPETTDTTTLTNLSLMADGNSTTVP